MRYAQGGGLTDAERTTRDRLRLQAVERFEGGRKNAEIATALRVSVRSVERWRRAWRELGEAGVLSKGSPGRSRLSEVQIARLERELERGSLAHGWADQRWTLARIKTLIGRLFHVSHTVEGTCRLLKPLPPRPAPSCWPGRPWPPSPSTESPAGPSGSPTTTYGPGVKTDMGDGDT
ncbi:transposase [Streptomyces mirabilis]|uniref:helix-turn-helix domain-containing protein n=1 Tax=Streptomyces mirabilis TaxID=68239 RepID=UPI0036CF9447